MKGHIAPNVAGFLLESKRTHCRELWKPVLGCFVRFLEPEHVARFDAEGFAKDLHGNRMVSPPAGLPPLEFTHLDSHTPEGWLFNSRLQSVPFVTNVFGKLVSGAEMVLDER